MNAVDQGYHDASKGLYNNLWEKGTYGYDDYEAGRLNFIKETEEKDHKKKEILEFLTSLSEDERMEIFCEFCRYCGSIDPGCYCWNDE